MQQVFSWGRLTADRHHVVALSDPVKAASLICNSGLGIAHGMGRSYGDVCLNSNGTLWCTKGLDHFIAFNDNTGRLVCEAGVLLRDIQRMAIPRGWILPVTPGTYMVTVGGAISNDVHGKNHHILGSFGDHVQRIKLIRTDGGTIECGPQLHPEWFTATVGGLGLTGVIVEVEIQLRHVPSSWLNTEAIPYSNLNEFFHLADDSESDWENTVSWIDCISKGGRGIFLRGNPADSRHRQEPKRRKAAVPLVPPCSLVNRLSLRLFNSIYYRLHTWRARCSTTHYEPFFYPLDTISEWNRIYGPRGFYQYQSVVPREAGQDATRSMLKEIARSGDGSFLGVLKTFGNRQSIGMLSFPQPGVTLALDFPNKGKRTHKLFERLDAVVKEAGGRIYPAKDARMPHELFESGYPRLDEFMKYRDPGISSGFSRRLMGN